MKQYLHLLLPLIFLSTSAFSQLADNRAFIFDASKSDSLKTSYVYSITGGNSIITLYNDSTYDFDVDSVDLSKAEFSCGRWKMENDSTISLQSDNTMLQDLFNRRPRSFAINQYSFLLFDQRKYVLVMNQSLKSLSPQITRSLNFN